MTFAQFIGDANSGIVGAINTFIVPVIFALAFAFFIWGVASRFFFHGDDETKREEGKKFILWGILGMVVMFSVWGLVNILLSTLGISSR